MVWNTIECNGGDVIKRLSTVDVYRPFRKKIAEAKTSLQGTPSHESNETDNGTWNLQSRWIPIFFDFNRHRRPVIKLCHLIFNHQIRKEQ
jgi:hypothetical protein